MFFRNFWIAFLVLTLCIPASSYKEPKFKTGLRWVFGVLALGAGAMSAYQYYRSDQAMNKQKSLQLQYHNAVMNSDFVSIREQFEAQGELVDQCRRQGLVWAGLGTGAGIGFGLTLVRF